MTTRLLLLALTTLSWTVAGQPVPNAGVRLQELSERAARQQRQGEYKAAEASYREILRLRPGMPEALSNLGLMLHLQGEYGPAIEWFSKALKARPGKFVPNLFLGSALTRLGRAREALPFLQRAVAISPEDTQAAYQLAQACASCGDFKTAKEYYGVAARIDQSNADAWFGLGISYLKLGQLASERLSKRNDGGGFARALLAEALVEQGQAERAVQIYLELRQAHLAPPCSKAGLGRAYLRQGKAAEAAVAFATRVDSGGRCPMGPLPQDYGGFTECARELSGQMAQLSAGGLLELARYSFYAGEAEWTFKAADRLAKANANGPEMLFWRAQAAQRLALAALGEAGRRAPDSHKMHLLLGDTYGGENHVSDAIAEYRRALALRPTDLAGHWGLARTYYQSLDYDEALTELGMVLDARPEDSEANYMAGQMLVAKRHMADAELYLKRALAGSAPHVPHAHALLASVYTERGAKAAAITELKQSLAADKDESYHLRIYKLY